MIARLLRNGVIAGAAGTSALNVATYIDMATRGRAASTKPQQAVDTIAARAGVDIPGEGEQRDNRREGLGALSGIATGCAVGIAAATMGPLMRRLPSAVSGLMLGALAMAATDVPMTRMRLTDPTQWSPADWASDAVPHLAYGIVTAWTAAALSRR